MPLRERQEVEEVSRAAGRVDFLRSLHDLQKRPWDSSGSSLPSLTTCAKNRTHTEPPRRYGTFDAQHCNSHWQ
jgi:hypothetical protein